MRHLGSLLVAALAAPLAFVLAGRGLAGLAEVAAAPTTEQPDFLAISASASAVGLAGLLYGLLTMPRFSPIGPGLAGAGYLTVGVLALTAPEQLYRWVPAEFSELAERHLTTAGEVAPLLAVPLLLTVLVPGRWRGRGRATGSEVPSGPVAGYAGPPPPWPDGYPPPPPQANPLPPATLVPPTAPPSAPVATPRPAPPAPARDPGGAGESDTAVLPSDEVTEPQPAAGPARADRPADDSTVTLPLEHRAAAPGQAPPPAPAPGPPTGPPPEPGSAG